MAADKITNSGLAIITNLLSGIGGTVPKYIDWGTGASAATTSDTALQTPAGESRTNGTPSRVTTTATNDTYQVVGTMTATAGRAITEAGLFDAATTGNMYQHDTFSTINLLTGDSIAFTLKSVFSCTS